ncbi:MAG: hypothetical protein MUF18_21655 [Fimbriiglobus sp.]|jgi:hypothetical protein|nr:hypothetical protein [Fimbriiglobus sp.]
MHRAEICSADDFDTQLRLMEVLRDLGFVADDTWHDDPLFGVGLTRYRLAAAELTVFKDAWLVDVAGPQELVEAVLRGMG